MGCAKRRGVFLLLCFPLLAASPGGRAAPGPDGAGRGGDCDLEWTVYPGANATEQLGSLSRLAAISEDDIWASGGYFEGTARHTLMQHWDGSQWSIVPSPDGPKPVSWIAGMSAVAADDVWAVGYSTDRDVGESTSETLIEHWDRNAWSVVPSPNLTTEDVGEEFGGHPVRNELMDVAAVSKDDIWAVGRSFTFTQGQELIIHWDGTSWSVVPSPHPGINAWLRGLTVLSSTDVWAFGEYYADVPLGGDEGGVGQIQQNLIEHWDGSTWSVVPSPNVPPIVNGLFGGSAVSPTDIWAVGYHLVIFGVRQLNQPHLLHWDGVSWSLVPVPIHNRETTYLYSISALSADDAIAVGFYDTGGPRPTYHTLVERWDGFTWNIVPSANPGDVNYLYALAVIFPDDVWAVGDVVFGEFGMPLIERYTTSCLDKGFVRGDSNFDGKVDLSDAVTTLGHLFLGLGEPKCLDAEDADDSGTVEITDPIFLLGSLFLGQVPPPTPFPECGLDPTPADGLGCMGSCPGA